VELTGELLTEGRAHGVGRLFEGGFDDEGRSRGPLNCEPDSIARPVAAPDSVLELFIHERHTVDGGDEIANLDSRLFGRAIRKNGEYF